MSLFASWADIKLQYYWKSVSCPIEMLSVGFKKMTTIDADRVIIFGLSSIGNFVVLDGSALRQLEYHSGWGKKWSSSK